MKAMLMFEDLSAGYLYLNRCEGIAIVEKLDISVFQMAIKNLFMTEEDSDQSWISEISERSIYSCIASEKSDFINASLAIINAALEIGVVSTGR